MKKFAVAFFTCIVAGVMVGLFLGIISDSLIYVIVNESFVKNKYLIISILLLILFGGLFKMLDDNRRWLLVKRKFILIFFLLFGIVIPTGFCLFNWKYEWADYDHLKFLLSLYTSYVTIGGACFAWSKWEEEKDRAKHEKCLINANGVLIDYLIRQETYRKRYLRGGDQYRKENTPLIDAYDQISSDIVAYKNVNEAIFMDILKDIDKSFMNISYSRLISQCLLFYEMEKTSKECLKKWIINERKNNYSYISFMEMDPESSESEEIQKAKSFNRFYADDISIQREIAKIKAYPDECSITPARESEIGEIYSENARILKNIQIELINRIIQEYVADLKALNIDHEELSWENIADNAYTGIK